MTTTPEKSPAQTDLVTLTIDGVEVSVPKGTLIIRAAEEFLVGELRRVVGEVALALVSVTQRAVSVV